MTIERLLYQQNAFPIFQNRMFDSELEARACPCGDIRLVQNLNSGLVYNAAFRQELMIYDVDYHNEQAHSSSFQEHLKEVACIVERTLGKHQLVEIGCGKGYFLELLQSRDCSIVGFDPIYEGANPMIHPQYFGQGMPISAEGIILRHVLEHIHDPFDFLVKLSDANHSGLVYIEVPSFDWIMFNCAWYDVFYEHVNYFRLSDFNRMFGKVIDCGYLFGGQYIYVVADLASLRPPLKNDADDLLFPSNFDSTKTIGGTQVSASPRTVWGAASKGVIYSLLRERAGNPVEILIDINPEKWGKYVPATGLRVMSPSEGMAKIVDGEDICIMNQNYLDEVRRMTESRFNLIKV